MKFHVTVSALVGCTVLLGACGDDPAAPAVAETTTSAAIEAPDTVILGANTPAAAPVAASPPLSHSAPVFASLYPAATLSKPVMTARENGSEGGIAEFTTPDSPQMVMDHYRRLAGSSGLDPVMAMNQGSARAFAAKNQNGAELQVVASSTEDGLTAVQLTWQAAN